jgi:hypothetical protein
MMLIIPTAPMMSPNKAGNKKPTFSFFDTVASSNHFLILNTLSLKYWTNDCPAYSFFTTEFY